MLRTGVWILVTLAVGVGGYFAVTTLNAQPQQNPPAAVPVAEVLPVQRIVPSAGEELATFGSGCFWCTEAVFAQVKGVKSVTSGYSGGRLANPTYRDVCTGTTGHAEVVQVAFDPTVVTYTELLEIFWKTHDPTTKNRQGADVGPQYRSVIFYHDDVQRKQAEASKKKLELAGTYKKKVVTELKPMTAFYAAEKEHQAYYATNPRAGYCENVNAPKVAKVRATLGDKVKSAEPTTMRGSRE